MAHVELDVSAAFGEGGLIWEDVVTLEPRLSELIVGMAGDWDGGLLPFLGLPEVNPDRLVRMAQQAREKFDRLVVLGIGGSALGARAVYESLTAHFTGRSLDGTERRSLWFSENVDPDELHHMLRAVDWERTQWNVVTKSGSTIETWSSFLLVRDELLRRFGADGARERIVVTTDPEHGPLRALAREEGLATLDVPPGVGGRFSGLSPVGLYPVAFAGIDVGALLSGAKKARDRCLAPDALNNPAALFAALQVLHYQARRHIIVFMPYARALLSLGEWFCQLWAESLGKRRAEDHIGPTPITALGVRDQHSQLQLYMEGPRDKNLLFVEVDQFRERLTIPRTKDAPSAVQHLCGRDMAEVLAAELKGTRQALVEEGCPVSTLRLRTINAEGIGAIMMFLEIATALAGGLLEVDPYNQPGVELGKRYAHGLLGRAKESHYAAALQAAESARESRRVTVM